MANEDMRSSRMDAELQKRKLEQLRSEREKIQEKLIKDSEAAFKGALLSNMKALEKMNKNLGALGGAVSEGKKASAKSLATNHAKSIAKNTDMMVKHAVSQINLLKSIDKSLINVASLLKPQFKVFERNLDALTVKVMDKTPVRVYQTMTDPRRSPFKKALDAIFGAQAPAQEVYVQNWKEIREGVSRTRTDLLGRVGQLLSTGIIGNITGMGGAFARGARYETTGKQHQRIMTEMRQGGDAAKILAREKAATQMSDIEKLYAGARGNAATFNMSSVFALGSKEGREDLVNIFRDMFDRSFKESITLFNTSMMANAIGNYSNFDSELKTQFAALRAAAQGKTGFSASKLSEEKMNINAFGIDAKIKDSSGIKEYAKAFAEATVEKTKKLKQSAGNMVDSATDAIANGIKTLTDMLGKMFATAQVKLMTKALFTVVKTGKHIKAIKDNTTEMLAIMKASSKGQTPAEKQRKGLFGWIGRRWKNRKSFRVTEKRKGTGALLGGAGRLLGGVAKLKTATIRGVFGGLGALFGKGSFRMSGIGGQNIKRGAKVAAMPLKGAAYVSGKGISGIRSLFGSLFGGDSFKLRRSKKDLEERRARRGGLFSRFRGGKNDLLFRIYKLLLRRLPTKRMWKKMRFGRGAKGGIMDTVKGALKNPVVGLGVAAVASVGAGINAIRKADWFGVEQRKADMRVAEMKQNTAKKLAETDKRTKKKFGISVSEFRAADDIRSKKGMSRIGSLPVLQELKKMGYSIEDNIPQEAINKATAAVHKAKGINKPIQEVPTKQESIKIAERNSAAAIGAPSAAQKVEIVKQDPNVLGSPTLSTEDARMKKLMTFLLGDFTNNLVMNMSKAGATPSGGTSGGATKGKATNLNVFQ
jgi:hypothetical protein